MKRPIAIVDYGMANLRSVQKALEAVGAEAEITGEAARIAEAGHVILPGVGAFQDAIALLRSTGLDDVIRRHVRSGRPFLGICLGLQLLFERSHEDGIHQGLGILKGDVVRFPSQPGLKVPHMGWNALRFTKKGCPLFQGLKDGDSVYFVHGYYPQPSDRDVISAEADYPTAFCAAVWQDNLVATQFHPEKSQAVGLQMLRNFAAMPV